MFRADFRRLVLKLCHCTEILMREALSFIKIFLGLFFPSFCTVCGTRMRDGEFVCEDCVDGIEWAGEFYCRKCGKGLGEYSEVDSCNECRGRHLYFKRVITVGRYSGTLRQIIYNFKFRGERELGVWLSEVLAKRIVGSGFGEEIDIIIPVPIHWWKFLKRRYNQSAIISREVSRLLSVPIYENILIKRRRSQAQSLLSRQERLHNIEGTFGVRRRSRILDKRVLLVDDVLTTGITCSECASVLKKAGARDVYVAVVGR